MNAPPLLRVIVFAAAFALASPITSLAQLPKRCLPSSTPAPEILDTHQGTEATMPAQAADTEPRRVVIDKVVFKTPIHLPDSDRNQLVADLQRRQFSEGSDWLTEIQKVAIRGAWQNQGFYKVNSNLTTKVIRADAQNVHVALTVLVNEGPQYKLGHLDFRAGDPDEHLAFPVEDLRKQIPMNVGDIFNADKIRQGLDALTNLYGSRGYIDFVATPLTVFDDSQRTVSRWSSFSKSSIESASLRYSPRTRSSSSS
jgi:hypothetical protein